MTPSKLYMVRASYLNSETSLTYTKKEAADAAFTAISEGLNKYREFRNDSSPSITVDLECGGRQMFRFDNMHAVCVTYPNTPELDEAIVNEHLRQAQMNASVKKTMEENAKFDDSAERDE